MPKAFTRNVAQAIGSLDRIAEVGVDQLLSGHGDPIPDPPAAVEQAKQRGPT